jgi:glycosyltransferase involved in cell wall biosynthesis
LKPADEAAPCKVQLRSEGLVPNALRRTSLALRLLVSGLQEPGKLRAALQAVCTPDSGGSQPEQRQLLVDVSVFAGNDAGTGIQRVTKALLDEVLAAPPAGYVIRPVRASRWSSYRYYGGPNTSRRVEIRSGDVFLGLDLSSRILPRRRLQLLAWKAAGARLCFVLYDLLPHLQPNWFTRRNSRAFAAWIRVVAVHADSVCCISRSVAMQFQQWLSENGLTPDNSPRVAWFRLGVEPPSDYRTPLQNTCARRVAGHQFVLVVGTLEPRKGHSLALEAFDTLWAEGHSTQLVLVGRVGWKVDALVSRLRRHPETEHRLHWLQNADDAALNALYAAARGVLVLSEGEGCGLPILEAAAHGKPLLVRDLPVFREIAGTGATYFDAISPSQFLPQLRAWLVNLERGIAISSQSVSLQGWSSSALQLLACALIPTPTPSLPSVAPTNLQSES